MTSRRLKDKKATKTADNVSEVKEYVVLNATKVRFYAVNLGITLTIWSILMNCTQVSRSFWLSCQTNFDSLLPRKKAHAHW